MNRILAGCFGLALIVFLATPALAQDLVIEGPSAFELMSSGDTVPKDAAADDESVLMPVHGWRFYRCWGSRSSLLTLVYVEYGGYASSHADAAVRSQASCQRDFRAFTCSGWSCR
jgi:hypothetical protein